MNFGTCLNCYQTINPLASVCPFCRMYPLRRGEGPGLPTLAEQQEQAAAEGAARRKEKAKVRSERLKELNWCVSCSHLGQDLEALRAPTGRCRWCGGQGFRIVREGGIFGLFATEAKKTCTDCQGTGRCQKCHGRRTFREYL